MQSLAPIVLFVYNRLDHTIQTIEALKKNTLARNSILYIYSDAAKNPLGQKLVENVREYISTIEGFKQLYIIKREKNFGLANSIVDGVTKIVNEYGKIIVLEDDLVTSPYFLEYMNLSLDKYLNEDKVYSITGYSFSDDIQEKIDETYFLPLTNSWGWATWADKWQVFERDAESLKIFLDNKKNYFHFNFGNSYPYTKLAKIQLANKSDSWAIYWYYSVFLNGGLTLYPSKKLVKNIGHDGSGTHCNTIKFEKITIDKLPSLTEKIIINKEYEVVIQNIIKTETAARRSENIKQYIKKIILNNFSMKVISNILKIKNKFKMLFNSKIYGSNTYIDKTVQMLGKSYISIGKNTIISEDTWFNVNDKIKDFKHIEIGNNCYIGKRNFLNSGKKIIFNDYVMTGIACQFLGSNHNIDDPLIPYISTGTTSDDVIDIGINVWLGANVTLLGNITIGHGSIIGAGSVATKCIPPFSIVVGSPAKIIKRYDFIQNKWIKIEDFNEKRENNMPNKDEYLNILKSKKPRIFLPLQASSKKFGDLV